MGKEQQKEFNRLCAEFMGYRRYAESDLFIHEDGQCLGFDPRNDANDRNKVIEKMGLGSMPPMHDKQEWRFFEPISGILRRNKSMEAAQIACIAAVLESKQ